MQAVQGFKFDTLLGIAEKEEDRQQIMGRGGGCRVLE